MEWVSVVKMRLLKFSEGPDFNVSYAIYSICYVNVTASESISITYRHAVFLPERVGTGGGTI